MKLHFDNAAIPLCLLVGLALGAAPLSHADSTNHRKSWKTIESPKNPSAVIPRETPLTGRSGFLTQKDRRKAGLEELDLTPPAQCPIPAATLFEQREYLRILDAGKGTLITVSRIGDAAQARFLIEEWNRSGTILREILKTGSSIDADWHVATGQLLIWSANPAFGVKTWKLGGNVQHLSSSGVTWARWLPSGKEFAFGQWLPQGRIGIFQSRLDHFQPLLLSEETLPLDVLTARNATGILLKRWTTRDRHQLVLLNAKTHRTLDQPIQQISAADLSADGKYALALGLTEHADGPELHRISLTKDAEARRLSLPGENIRGFYLSPSGTVLTYWYWSGDASNISLKAWLMDSSGQPTRLVTALHLGDWDIKTIVALESQDRQPELAMVVSRFDTPETLFAWNAERNLTWQKPKNRAVCATVQHEWYRWEFEGAPALIAEALRLPQSRCVVVQWPKHHGLGRQLGFRPVSSYLLQQDCTVITLFPRGTHMETLRYAESDQGKARAYLQGDWVQTLSWISQQTEFRGLPLVVLGQNYGAWVGALTAGMNSPEGLPPVHSWMLGTPWKSLQKSTAAMNPGERQTWDSEFGAFDSEFRCPATGKNLCFESPAKSEIEFLRSLLPTLEAVKQKR